MAKKAAKKAAKKTAKKAAKKTAKKTTKMSPQRRTAVAVAATTDSGDDNRHEADAEEERGSKANLELPAKAGVALLVPIPLTEENIESIKFADGITGTLSLTHVHAYVRRVVNEALEADDDDRAAAPYEKQTSLATTEEP